MLIKSGKRGAGKTTMAIGWLLSGADRILLVRDTQEARRIEYQFNLKKEESSRVIPFFEYLKSPHRLFYRDVKIGIDNAEIILNKMLGNKLEFLTLTEQLEEKSRYVKSKKQMIDWGE